MKKVLIALTIVLSCIGINKVRAETYNLVHSNTYEYGSFSYYSDYNYIKEIGYDDEMQELYYLLINEYNSNYNVDYPYYILTYNIVNYNDCNQSDNSYCVSKISSYLQLYKEIPDYSYNVNAGYYRALPNPDMLLLSSYDIIDSLYNLPDIHNSFIIDSFNITNQYYNELAYFISNFNLVNNTEDTFVVTGNSNFTINPGDVIKPYYSVENAFQNNYTEINLNDYAYVALALKDYVPKTFETTVQVKGQYCITPVYNYGMSSYDSVVGTKVQNVCSPYYGDYTPVKTYITFDNFQNNAIYYVKAYNTEQENYIKVDTTVFDITYITEDEKDEPYVYIQGKYYPTIPYDELPSSATQNTEDGYIPGQVEEFSFSDIFTAPLEFLEDIWDSIVSVFGLINEFLSLLPPVMQNFIYASFMLGMSIGLLKLFF